MNAKERLLQYLKYKGIGQGKFERACGISNGYISNNKGSIGTETLTKISSVDEFSDLNYNWLIHGNGSMTLQFDNNNVQQNIVAEEASIYTSASSLLEQLSKLTDTVLSQQRTIENLIAENKKTAALLADNATNADAHGA